MEAEEIRKQVNSGARKCRERQKLENCQEEEQLWMQPH